MRRVHQPYADVFAYHHIDLSAPGVSIGVPDLKMGHRGQVTADIVLEKVEVPADYALGEAGQGMPVALSALVRGRTSRPSARKRSRARQ